MVDRVPLGHQPGTGMREPRSLEETLAEHPQQLVALDRLGDIGAGAGIDAALELAGSGLGGQGDDREPR